MVRSCEDRQAAEHARGAAEDQWAEEDKRPYTFDGLLEDGDEVRDHTEHGDGEVVEYDRETTTDEWRGQTHRITTVTLGTHPVDVPMRCKCEATGDEFAPGTVPAGAPMTCPVCGADGTRDDVDTCTDARGASGASQDTDDQDDHTAGQDDGSTQAALTGYTEADN